MHVSLKTMASLVMAIGMDMIVMEVAIAMVMAIIKAMSAMAMMVVGTLAMAWTRCSCGQASLGRSKGRAGRRESASPPLQQSPTR